METLAYQTGVVRVTRFKWDDAHHTLSWTVEGSVPKEFTELFLTIISAECVQTSPVVQFDDKGSIQADHQSCGDATMNTNTKIFSVLFLVALAIIIPIGCLVYHSLSKRRNLSSSSAESSSDSSDSEQQNS